MKSPSRRLNFFTDENFSPQLAAILRIFDENVTIQTHAQVFAPGIPDEDWLPQVRDMNPRPIVLCGDGRILNNPARLAALKTADTHFVVLAEGFVNLPWKQMVQKMLAVWDVMCAAVYKQRHHSIFKVRVKSRDVDVVGRLVDYQSHSDIDRTDGRPNIA